jgi:hypothetical protein
MTGGRLDSRTSVRQRIAAGLRAREVASVVELDGDLACIGAGFDGGGGIRIDRRAGLERPVRDVGNGADEAGEGAGEDADVRNLHGG